MKTKRTTGRLLSLLLAVLLLLSLLPVSALAAGETGGYFGTADRAYWSYNTGSHTLMITAPYGTVAHMSYGNGASWPWDDYRADITTVVIGDKVNNIGWEAFKDCTSLTSVTISSSVDEIEYDAFNGCTSLAQITIPGSVDEIGENAFEGCTSLDNVTIPNAVTRINENTFMNCTSLEHITIPGSVTWIDKEAFKGCSSLTGLSMPLGLEFLGEGVFMDCTSLTSVTIPDTVTRISKNTFMNCTSLTSITIPNSVEEIGEYAFSGCTSLAQITLPSTVESIGAQAFSGCTMLDTVDFAKDTNGHTSLTTIGSDAFSGCTDLQNITLPDSLTTIGPEAFSGSGLNSISIPDSVTKVGGRAFGDCLYLSSIEIPQSLVVNIQNIVLWHSALSGCEGVTVEFKDNVTGIGDRAFDSCTEISGVEFHGNIKTIGSSAFKDCTNLSGVEFTEGLESIGNNAFNRCRGITSVDIPESVTSIGLGAFDGCSGLVSVYMTGDIETIGNGAFNGTSVEYFEVSGSLVKTGVRWGNFAPGLAYFHVEILPGATAIGDEVFYGCSTLKSITIPDSVRSIGGRAFEGNTGIESITIPSGVTTIGNRAFNNPGIRTVTIPKSVTQMGDYVFYTSSTPKVDVYYEGTKEERDALMTRGADPLNPERWHYPYNISVTDGTARVKGKSVTKVYSGETVTVTANDKQGAEFTNWSLNTGSRIVTFDDANASTTTFTMPQGNVSVKANYSHVALLQLASDDYKKTYIVGDALDVRNMKVRVLYYGAGAPVIANVTADMVSGFDSSTPGTKHLTITLEDKTVTGIAIQVMDGVSKIEITRAPDKPSTGAASTNTLIPRVWRSGRHINRE